MAKSINNYRGKGVSQTLQEYPFVSVVVTVYNAERTIGKCLESIMKLEYPEDKLEVLVIDDGSTDNSVDMIRKYPVRLLRKRNSGYPSAMNAGIRKSRGNIVVIVDSDIYITREWLVKVLREFDDSKVGIVEGYVATAPTKNFWAKLAGYEVEDRCTRIESKYMDYLSSTCTAYRKEIFDSVGFFDEGLRRNSDEDLSHRAFKYGWKLIFRKDVMCFHDWRSSFGSYFMQQLYQGKYMVKIIRKAPSLLLGKRGQPAHLYVPIVLTFLLFLAPLYFFLNCIWVLTLLLAGLIVYHIPVTIRILNRHRDWAMLLFPIAINVRYVAWLMGFVAGIMTEIIQR